MQHPGLCWAHLGIVILVLIATDILMPKSIDLPVVAAILIGEFLTYAALLLTRLLPVYGFRPVRLRAGKP